MRRLASVVCTSVLAMASVAVAADYAVTAVPAAGAHAPVIPGKISGKDGVKDYLMSTINSVNAACADFKVAAVAYQDLVKADGGTPEAAAKAKPQEMADLIKRLRDDYEKIDSYGYEYMEGIVAGVPSLMKYDVELDSGVPTKGASLTDQIANIKIVASDITVDHEGSLNNYLMEPTVYGTNLRFTEGTATLPGFDKPVNLPKPGLCVALGDYAIDGYARLKKDSDAWQPSDRDCFLILSNMTPTLADYFDDWKESKKYGAASGGRFVAVSRVSDMRGIMSSVRLTWLALADKVQAKDAPLATKITTGYDGIIKFINRVDVQDQKAPLKVETIDALGTQAKESADKLTVQANTAAALMGVDVNAK